MYVCEGPGWIKTNGQGGFCGPKMTYRHSISPRHCNTLPWIQQTLWALNRLYCPLLAKMESADFGFWKKEKCKVFLNSVCLFKFGNCVQQVFSWKIFSLQSLQKKRHLLEHDKHLATGLWLMGPKTEVWSVHFERWVIYPHFSFFTLGGWEKTPSPLTDSHCWMCGLIIHECGPFHVHS